MNRDFAINLSDTGEQASIPIERYRLIVIAVAEAYSDPWPPLQAAVTDARAVASILTKRYGFEIEAELYEGAATASNICDALRSYAKGSKSTDALVVYYAGHGHLDDVTQSGVWIPTDGGAGGLNWLENDTIKKLINAMRSRHVLLLSDSCFSGDFFRAERRAMPEITDAYVRRAYARRARQAITSGGLEPVVDQSLGGKSPFAYWLCRALDDNLNSYIVPSEIFQRIKGGVAENAKQQPQIGRLFGTGGESEGELVFLNKAVKDFNELMAERQARLSELEQAEAAQREFKDVITAEEEARQIELDRLDQAISASEKRLNGSGLSGQTMDDFLSLVQERGRQAKQLEALKKQRKAEEMEREVELQILRNKELAQRKASFVDDYAKFKQVRGDEFTTKEITLNAWKILCQTYEVGGIRHDNIVELDWRDDRVQCISSAAGNGTEGRTEAVEAEGSKKRRIEPESGKDDGQSISSPRRYVFGLILGAVLVGFLFVVFRHDRGLVSDTPTQTEDALSPEVSANQDGELSALAGGANLTEAQEDVDAVDSDPPEASSPESEKSLDRVEVIREIVFDNAEASKLVEYRRLGSDETWQRLSERGSTGVELRFANRSRVELRSLNGDKSTVIEFDANESSVKVTGSDTSDFYFDSKDFTPAIEDFLLPSTLQKMEMVVFHQKEEVSEKESFMGKTLPSELLKSFGLWAAFGNSDAQLLLGWHYQAVNNYESAVPLLSRASAQKNRFASASLGDVYRLGLGVEKNYRFAELHYKRALEEGINTAQSGLLGLIFIGIGNDDTQVWVEKLADKGNAFCQALLGFDYLTSDATGGTDFVIGRELLEKSADQGNAYGQAFLGIAFARGMGVLQDHGKARELIEKSALQGNSYGQVFFGLLYKQGDGVEQSYSVARGWYEKSAAQGNLFGQFGLGGIYHYGLGLDKDYAVAQDWYLKSASQGYADALRGLGEIYQTGGHGVTQSRSRAIEWFEKASAQGDQEARKRLQELKVSQDKQIEAGLPQTMTETFTRFQSNRAKLIFTSTEQDLFSGRVAHNTSVRASILAKDQSGVTYIITHSADSPFDFVKKANNLLSVSLEVSIGNQRIAVSQIGFLSVDPRIIFVPLPQSVVDASGLETFPIALQPKGWEDVILVKSNESNFGRTGFRRLSDSERFLKVDRPAIGELFSSFDLSRSDLVFTNNGQFLGMLNDSKHAVVIDEFLASGVTQLGSHFSTQENAVTMNRLRERVKRLPEEVR